MSVDLHTLAGAFALDAVNDIERAEFARHMAQCPGCAQEVAELRATTARLADVVAEPAPAYLRHAVLAEIRQTRQLGPQLGPQHREPAPRNTPTRWRRAAAAAVVAALATAGASTASYVVQDHRVRDARAQAASARDEVAAAQAQAVAARAQAATARQIAAILGAPDARGRESAIARGALVRFVTSPSMGEGVAILSGLPDPVAGHSYQLWLISGTPLNVGVVQAGSSQQLVADLHDATTFAISVERSTTKVSTPSKDILCTMPLA